MSDFDMSEYRAMFLEEAEELFESADNILLRAEEEQSLEEEDMNSLFRDVHTLKGSGASVELSYFAEFTHDVETMMDKLRNHAIEFIPSMATILIESMDVMKEILDLEVEEEITRESFDEKTASLLKELKEFIAGGVPARFKGAASAATPAPTASASAPVGNTESGSGDEDAFGFFDDGLAQKQLLSREESNQNDETGFFETTNESNNNGKYGLFSDNDSESYGLFSDQKSSSNNQENFKSADVPKEKLLRKSLDEVNADMRPDSEAFGFFDKEEAPSENNKPNTIIPTKANNQPTKDKKKTATAAASIRVHLDKIDVLMNNVGDLVITNAMLGQYATTIDDMKVQSAVLERLDLLDRHIREMQDSIMGIRMVPMESVYSKFPKL